MELKLVCQNKACSACLKEEKVQWDGKSTYSLISARKCPLCGKSREIVNEEIPENGGKLETIGTSLIDSMTPMQRKALLKERSNRDFQKNISERKREMDKNVIPK